jgi:glutathione S-transferase-like protein
MPTLNNARPTAMGSNRRWAAAAPSRLSGSRTNQEYPVERGPAGSTVLLTPESAMLELYHDWRSFCSIKVRLCLAEKGLTWESRFIDLMKLEHTSPDYLKLNPNGLVPTLVRDGVAIYESTLINEYLDEVFPEVPLMPRDPIERARARYWVKFEDDVRDGVMPSLPCVVPRAFAIAAAIEARFNLLSADRRRSPPLCCPHPETTQTEA